MLQLFTDTSANLPVALTKQHHITVVPFSYTVDGKETDYPDDVDFDGAAFYGAMRRGAVVKTSMVNPALMANYFERALSQGDDVLYVGMSGGISGTAQAAVIAAGELTEKYPARKIVTIDTYAASLGEGLQVLEAAQRALALKASLTMPAPITDPSALQTSKRPRNRCVRLEARTVLAGSLPATRNRPSRTTKAFSKAEEPSILKQSTLTVTG